MAGRREHGHAPLVHAGRGEGGEADDVAGRVDAGGRGPVAPVHLDEAGLVGLDPRRLEAETAHVGLPARGHEHPVGPDHVPGLAPA